MKSPLALETVISTVYEWLSAGEFDPAILADEFYFRSPIYGDKAKPEFLKAFVEDKSYRDVILPRVHKNDPVLFFKGLHNEYFVIVRQFHTKVDGVYEAILGKVNAVGYLTELRPIYDSKALTTALELG